jgi:hypothetical protein
MKQVIIGLVAWAALLPSFERSAHAQPGPPPPAVSPVIYAASYVLLGQPDQPAQVCRTGWDGDSICTAIDVGREKPLCQLPPPPRSAPNGNHLTIRWRPSPRPLPVHRAPHHRHHHHHGWRFDDQP